MSLINQVLRDLEQRQNCPAAAANGVLQGLDVPTEAPRPPARNRSRVVAAYIAVFTLFVAGLFLLALAFFGDVPMFASSGEAVADARPVSTADSESTVNSTATPQKLITAAETPVREPTVKTQAPATVIMASVSPKPVATKPPATKVAPLAAETAASPASSVEPGANVAKQTEVRSEKPARAPIPAPVTKPVAQTRISKRSISPTSSATPIKATVVAATEADVSATGAVAKQRRPLTARQQATVAFKTGHTLMMKRRYGEAEVALREALALDPRHLKARELLAGSYLRRGNLADAARLMQDGLAVAPAHTVFTKLYARILAEQNAVPSAIHVLTRNVPPVADDLEYHALLAALYQRQGQYKQAARTYSELVKLRRKAGMWWIGLGVSLEALGKKTEATLAFQNARDSDSLSGKLLQYVEARLAVLGHRAKAVD